MCSLILQPQQLFRNYRVIKLYYLYFIHIMKWIKKQKTEEKLGKNKTFPWFNKGENKANGKCPFCSLLGKWAHNKVIYEIVLVLVLLHFPETFCYPIISSCCQIDWTNSALLHGFSLRWSFLHSICLLSKKRRIFFSRQTYLRSHTLTNKWKNMLISKKKNRKTSVGFYRSGFKFNCFSIFDKQTKQISHLWKRHVPFCRHYDIQQL